MHGGVVVVVVVVCMCVCVRWWVGVVVGGGSRAHGLMISHVGASMHTVCWCQCTGGGPREQIEMQTSNSAMAP